MCGYPISDRWSRRNLKAWNLKSWGLIIETNLHLKRISESEQVNFPDLKSFQFFLPALLEFVQSLEHPNALSEKNEELKVNKS